METYFILIVAGTGKYFNGSIGWTGAGTTEDRFKAMIYTFDGIDSLRNSYGDDFDRLFDMIMISEKERNILIQIQKADRDLRNLLKEYNFNSRVGKYNA